VPAPRNPALDSKYVLIGTYPEGHDYAGLVAELAHSDDVSEINAAHDKAVRDNPQGLVDIKVTENF